MCSFPVVWFYLRNYKPFSRTKVFFTWLLYNVGSFYCQFSCIVAQESVTTTVIRGSKTAKLTAILSGGNGDAAWQQAQLFSQPINDNDSSLEITITLQDVKWKMKQSGRSLTELYRGVCIGASFEVHDLSLSSRRKTEMILTSIFLMWDFCNTCHPFNIK